MTALLWDSSIGVPFALLAVAVALSWVLLRPKAFYKLPPGPPGLPVLGNLIEMLTPDLHR